jgi:hypothetical protein
VEVMYFLSAADPLQSNTSNKILKELISLEGQKSAKVFLIIV